MIVIFWCLMQSNTILSLGFKETKNNTNNQLTPSQAEIEAKEEHKLQRLENTFKIIHAIVSRSIFILKM